MSALRTLDDIYAEQDRWQDRLNAARERESLARKRIEQCHGHLGITRILTAIVVELAPHFPDHRLYVLGPFGLTNEASIHANDPLTIETVGSLSFRLNEDGTGRRRLVLVDRGSDTKQFPEGSIGERNGLNYAEVDLPEGGITGLVYALIDSIDNTVYA